MITLSQKKLPAVIEAQHDNCSSRLLQVESARDVQAYRNRIRFYATITALIAWYVGGPFAGGPPLHFVVQAVGVLLVTYAVGVLRALQSFVELRGQLANVRFRLLDVEGDYGIDFSSGTGNPAENAAKLTPKVIDQIKKAYAQCSDEIAFVEKELEKSLFTIYLELFSALKTGSKETALPNPRTNH